MSNKQISKVCVLIEKTDLPPATLILKSHLFKMCICVCN